MKTKPIKLNITFTPGSTFQHDFILGIVRSTAKAFERSLPTYHKKNKVEFFIEH